MRPYTFLIGAAFLALPALAMRVEPANYQGGRSRDVGDQEERNSGAVAMILGQLRASVADMMFIKTELYLHNGVAYRPHLNINKIASQGVVENKEEKKLPPGHFEGDGHDHSGHDHDHDHGHDHDHDHAAEPAKKPLPPGHFHGDGHDHSEHAHAEDPGHVHDENCDHGHDVELSPEDKDRDFAKDFAKHQAEVGAGEHHHHEGEELDHAETMIQGADKDFRGFIGELHRRVKPWEDPSKGHKHTDGNELLPWYRMMTLSDPHNVRAYQIGSWWLKNRRTAVHREEALKFLDEGIRNNPKAFQLPMMKGYLLQEISRTERDDPFSKVGPARIQEMREEAAKCFAKAAELAAAARPAEGTKNPRWTDYNEDDARASMRMHVFMLKEFGRAEEALASARKHSAAVGGDARLEENIRQLESEISGVLAPVK